MFQKLILLLTITVSSNLVFAQPSAQDISSNSDTFENSSTLTQWKKLDETEGWASKINKAVVENGQLIIEPATSGWFADLQAPFLYKDISGDFDVRSRLKASGRNGSISKTLWSLGGLMVRVAKRSGKDQWKPHEENWLFINTGVAQESGKQVIESKYTLNSKSNLKLREGKSEWITLRIVRVGHSFISLYKYDQDKNWTVQDRYYIADLPPTLQIGFQCYTNSEAVPPNVRFGDPLTFNTTVYHLPEGEDMQLVVDFIEFRRPPLSFSSQAGPGATWLNNVSKNNLTDYSITNAELLKLIGQ
jgi:hypothetical protein